MNRTLHVRSDSGNGFIPDRKRRIQAVLSKTTEYALRAVATIARAGGKEPVLARDIAVEGEIPTKYLSKILRDLVRAGVLDSTRGIGGGFRLRRPAETLKLIDVVAPFEDVLAARRCPFGNDECSGDDPCTMHEQWRPVAEAFRTLMEKTTVADIIRKEEPVGNPT
jgi:Rrf2 family protein